MRFGTSTTWRWLVPIVALVTTACTDPRTRPDDSCPTWKDDLAPKVAAACATSGCHAAPGPAGGYDLTSYLGALGPGSDTTANAIAGDASSAILTTIDPATATGPHAGLGALFAALQPWVTTCDVAYFDSPLHPGGIINPASDEFHGKELQRRSWDFALCQKCHGTNFGGTAVVPACTTCHTKPGGPTACDTCHPAEPTSNAHTTHIARGFACTTCHDVPLAWNQEGHILRGGVVDPPPAEVNITSALASTTIVPGDRTGPPAYDPITHTCAQVYCHGQVLGPTGATNPVPVWTNDPVGPPPCSSCHGAPPTSHARARCAECHPGGDRHLDGMIEIGNGLPGCAGCHGSEASPAPPRDLSGNTEITAIGVGAHLAHLTQPHRLTTPLPCTTCHVVPATITAPGHLDSTDPAEVVAAVGWDRTSRTCGTAFCHGASRPVWTERPGVFCGSCHGVPPATPAHRPGLTLNDCVGCHGRTVDAFGNIKITDGPNGPVSTHINGAVDAP